MSQTEAKESKQEQNKGGIEGSGRSLQGVERKKGGARERRLKQEDGEGGEDLT